MIYVRWPGMSSSVSASGSHCSLVRSLLDPLWFCITPFGPISIAPLGDAGMVIVEIVVLLSIPEECLLGRFAGSMPSDVLSRPRSSSLLLIRAFRIGLCQVLRIGYSVVSRPDESYAGVHSCAGCRGSSHTSLLLWPPSFSTHVNCSIFSSRLRMGGVA
jgi:hypothetical protein